MHGADRTGTMSGVGTSGGSDQIRRERPWWLRLNGLPPSAERRRAAMTREPHLARLGLLALACFVVALALSLAWGLVWLAGPIGAIVGAVAPQTKFFSRPVER